MAPKKAKSKSKKNQAQQTMNFRDVQKFFTKKYDKINDASGETIIPLEKLNEMTENPREYTRDSWIIVNVVSFLEEVEQLYSACSLFCTPDTCPLFNSGPNLEYAWKEEDSEYIVMSAPEYFNTLKAYIKRILSNSNMFPKDSNAPLSEKANQTLMLIYRRLLRILSHLYMCHFKLVKNNGIEIVINTILAHYTIFGTKNGLIDEAGENELFVLRPIYEKMGINFDWAALEERVNEKKQQD